jgi:hypothetical protein
VEADLQRFYQVDLVDMYRGRISVRKVAVLVLNLPRAAQTWIAYGGWSAVSGEVESAWLIEHALYAIAHGQAGGKGKRPEVREYPPGIHEQAAKAAATASKAEAWRAKHGRKTD